MPRKVFVKVLSDCRASSILKTVPVSQDSKELCSVLGEFVHNNTKPLFGIAWHFRTNSKYSSEVSLMISVDIHRQLTQCVRTWIFSKGRKHWDFTPHPSSTVASTFNSRQYLQLLEIPKQILHVLRGIKRSISWKMVKISDCGISSFLKQFSAAGYLDYCLKHHQSCNLTETKLPRST